MISRWDTLRLLGAIETHRNRAVYISLNTNANPTPNPFADMVRHGPM